LTPVSKVIYGLLGVYLLLKDPLYQLQAVLLGDVPLKMSYVKLFLLLSMMMVVPLFLGSSRLTKRAGWLLLIVVYNFIAVVFLNNRFPLEDRLTIYYIVMFLPLLLLVLDLADIRFGTIRDGTRSAGRTVFLVFLTADLLVGILQPLVGPEYYARMGAVPFLSLTPNRFTTIYGQIRSLGFFLDAVQHGLFLNFALYFTLGIVGVEGRKPYLFLVPLILANIYLTYTRNVYLLTVLNGALFLLVGWYRKSGSRAARFAVKQYWIASLAISSAIYAYGLGLGESDFSRSLLERFLSAKLVLESAAESFSKLMLGIGYIQNELLFKDFVVDNILLANLSFSGLAGVFLLVTFYLQINRGIFSQGGAFLDGVFRRTSFLFFSNLFAFGTFNNYLDTIYMFFIVPLAYFMNRDRMPSASPGPETRTPPS
jgi:hypothetical protein